MKNVLGLALLAFATLVMVGCSNPEETGEKAGTETTAVAVENCAECGCAKGCENCCKEGECDCKSESHDSDADHSDEHGHDEDKEHGEHK